MATPTRVAELTPEQRITLAELRIQVEATRQAKTGLEAVRGARDAIICKLRDQGLSLRQIGNPVGLSPTDVLNVLKSKGMA